MRGLVVVCLLAACPPLPPGDGKLDGAPADVTVTSAGMPADSGGVVSCPLDDIVLHTQDDAAALAGCADAFGDLTIACDLSDLTPLADLRQVAGTLRIVGRGEDDSRVLTSLEGLHNIEHIGGSLGIEHCDTLTDLNGLRGLKRIEGRGLWLSDLGLTTLHGLESLAVVGVPGGEPSRVRLEALPSLASLDALSLAWHDTNEFQLIGTGVSDLATFAGVTTLHGVRLVDNESLTDLTGLESLAVVTDYLYLHHNYALADISALANLQSLGDLYLRGAQPFSSLAPLTALTSIDDIIIIDSLLEDLDIPALQQVGPVQLQGNERLAGLSILAGRTSLQDLVIDRTALADLSDLSALTTVVHDLEIRDNHALGSLAEVAAITTVHGRLVVAANPELPQVDALAWGQAISVGLDRKIAGNKGDGPPLAPCPWEGDGDCDVAEYGGVDLCAPEEDVTDCTVGGGD